MATKPTKKAKKKTKPTPRPRAAKGPDPVGVGDAVRMPTEASNTFRHYDPRQEIAGRGAGAIEGLVCAVREVATGKLVAKTKGPLSGYVLEVLHDRTFHPQFSGNINSGGPKGPIVARENAKWARIRGSLTEMAKSGKLVSQASGALGAEPFAGLLDGWRVVKLHADLVELM
jgi:hypothetical protein